MSRYRTWKNRKHELQQKEQLLLDDLNGNGSKARKIALWSLGTGLVALVGYGIYRVFSSDDETVPKKSKKEKRIPKDSPLLDSAVENLAPKLGKWLLKQMKD